MFMLKALGVILGIGLSVVFFTVLLGVGWVSVVMAGLRVGQRSQQLQ